MRGAHKKKGRLRCHKRPKSREETPKEGSDSGVGVGGRYRIPQAKTIAISGSIERKGSRTDTKVYDARPQGRALPQWVNRVGLTGPRRLPVYPDERTFSGQAGMSEKCQKQKSSAHSVTA
jgi:hypothetical protein